MKRDSRQAVKVPKRKTPRGRRGGRAKTPDVSLSVVPLDVLDGAESDEPDGGEGTGRGNARLTPDARLAILEGIAADPDAKPGERIRAIEMLDARDSGAGMRRSRSLFSIAREPVLTADPDTPEQT